VLVSDVPENALDALASGPTMPDSTTVSDCYDIVKRYRLLEHFPPSVRALFDREQLQETPKAGDPAFAHSHYATVLSNATAVNAAVEQAALYGFAVEIDNGCDDWDYRKAADHLLRRVRELRHGVSRACWSVAERSLSRWDRSPAWVDVISNSRSTALRRLQERTSPC